MRAQNFPLAASALGVLITFAGTSPVQADWELSFYTGFQSAPHSRVKGDANGTDFNFLAEWEGRPFEAPPYYGFRATYWKSPTFGWGVDFNHTKVYATDDTLADSGFDDLELTDGLNILTLNAYRRWPSEERKWTPYVGGGLGLSIPHVDAEFAGSNTFEYQITGPAAAWMAGVTYPLNENWSVFGEYKGTFSSNDASLEGGGSLKTNIITNALNIGVSYGF
ncbi:MAG: outer membrane beta-barrel protein [Pseudomonadota bacterium]